MAQDNQQLKVEFQRNLRNRFRNICFMKPYSGRGFVVRNIPYCDTNMNVDFMNFAAM